MSLLYYDDQPGLSEFQTAFVSSPNNYSTVMNQQLALPIPIGSQLNLLNAQNAGNPYLDQSRLSNMKLGSLQNVLPGYNTLTHGNSVGYSTFSSAYKVGN